VLSGILNSIRELLRTWIHTVVNDIPKTAPLYREHLRIFRAVEQQDPDATAEAMGAHMDSVSKRLLQVVERDAGVAPPRA
jgi:GntR family transcriptional repressor for pyruvate dehydrogenase complex